MAFKVCSSCRKEIDFGATYWVCSVSTCNSKKMGLFFCSVPCWEAHLPSMRHREAWAVEKRAPKEGAEPAAPAPQPKPQPSPSSEAPRRRVVGGGASSAPSTDELPRDVLIVVSKLKKYIRARSGFNTSDSVLDVLSDEIREICDRAIRHAGQEGRKTVLDRDVKAVT